jgi:hypothetical protein
MRSFEWFPILTFPTCRRQHVRDSPLLRRTGIIVRPIQEQRMCDVSRQLLPIRARGKGSNRFAAIFKNKATQLVTVPGSQALANQACYTYI